MARLLTTAALAAMLAVTGEGRSLLGE